MGTQLSNKGFTIPTVDSDFTTWGPELNNGWINLIDGVRGGIEILTSSMIAAGQITLASSQAYNFLFDILTGSTGNLKITFLSSAFPNGLLTITNGASNGLLGAVTTLGQMGHGQMTLAPWPASQLVAFVPGFIGFAGDAKYKPASIGVHCDAIGTPFLNGEIIGRVTVPFNCMIKGYYLLANASDTLFVDVVRITGGGPFYSQGGILAYPSGASITGGNFMFIQNSFKMQAFPPVWSDFILNSGDILEFVTKSNGAAASMLDISLRVQRT